MDVRRNRYYQPYQPPSVYCGSAVSDLLFNRRQEMLIDQFSIEFRSPLTQPFSRLPFFLEILPGIGVFDVAVSKVRHPFAGLPILIDRAVKLLLRGFDSAAFLSLLHRLIYQFDFGADLLGGVFRPVKIYCRRFFFFFQGS